MGIGDLDAISAHALTGEESAALKRKLGSLLLRAARLYVMGETSSLPTKTVSELSRSCVFLIHLSLKKQGLPEVYAAKADLDLLWKDGCDEAKRLVKAAKQMLTAANRTAPSLPSRSLRDTLSSVPEFFKCYDMRFFAHEVPGASIDYPLAAPLPGEFLGVEYIFEYLKRIVFENALLARFDAELCDRLLRSIHADYGELIINLCEQVMINAAGRFMLGLDPTELDMGDRERQALGELMASRPIGEAGRKLYLAADGLCKTMSLPEEARSYLSEVAASAAPRAASADLSGVFLSLCRR